MQCYTCTGGCGYVTCPNCHGEGKYFKVVQGLGNVFEICWQCGGKRTVTCPTCKGKGEVPDVKPLLFKITSPSVQAKQLPPDPALLQLEGSWKGAGGWRYEFVKQNDGYRVTQFNRLGWKMGEGEAKASGSVLTLTVRNKITGPMTVDLQLSGNQLTGTTRGLIAVAFALERA